MRSICTPGGRDAAPIDLHSTSAFDAPRDGGHALLAPAHQDDALDVSSSLSWPAIPSRGAFPTVTLADVAQFQPPRNYGREQGVAYVVQGMDQADAAHHRRLHGNVDGLGAHIDVAVVEGPGAFAAG